MQKPKVVTMAIDRPNLYLDVQQLAHDEDKIEKVLSVLQGGIQHAATVRKKIEAVYDQAGIIYTATTAAAEQLATVLHDNGLAAGFYHGQQPKADRVRVQNDFMRGKIKIVVATNAFGMGIDKADVSFVIHYDVPPNLESYYQEAGRAGRGGQFAVCTLLYRSEDMAQTAFHTGTHDESRKVYEQGRQEMMRRYAEQPVCRRTFILNYFGEAHDGICTACDACLSGSHTQAASDVLDDRFIPGHTVVHKTWGEGIVQRIEENTIMVLFKTVGHKMLNVDLVERHELLSEKTTLA